MSKYLKKNGICIELANLRGEVNFMFDIDDKDKEDSGAPPCGGKFQRFFINFLISVLIILVALFLWRIFIDVELAKEGMTLSREFMPILRNLRDHMILYVIDEKQGIDENYVVTNEREFLSGLKETVYKLSVYKPFRRINMKKCFEAGIFKILTKDNVCYIYTDLTKASQYFSGKPLILRKNIAYEAAFLAQRYWKGLNPAKVLQKREKHVLLAPFVYLYLGKPDMTSWDLFTQEMNDLYLPVLLFRNTPSISLGEIP